MTIIFLDIDGVLTSARTGWMNWDIYATTFLKWACKQSGAKIVISSTWRCNRDREFFVDIFGEEIIHADWRTPWDLSNFLINCRGDEIDAWLTSNPEVGEYIIIDDDNDMLPEQLPSLILTESMNGITWNDMQKISKSLGMTEDNPCNMNSLELVTHPNMFFETNKSQSINQKIKFTGNG